jgi:hypothetical protein
MAQRHGHNGSNGANGGYNYAPMLPTAVATAAAAAAAAAARGFSWYHPGQTPATVGQRRVNPGIVNLTTTTNRPASPKSTSSAKRAAAYNSFQTLAAAPRPTAATAVPNPLAVSRMNPWNTNGSAGHSSSSAAAVVNPNTAVGHADHSRMAHEFRPPQYTTQAKQPVVTNAEQASSEIINPTTVANGVSVAEFMAVTVPRKKRKKDPYRYYPRITAYNDLEPLEVQEKRYNTYKREQRRSDLIDLHLDILEVASEYEEDMLMAMLSQKTLLQIDYMEIMRSIKKYKKLEQDKVYDHYRRMDMPEKLLEKDYREQPKNQRQFHFVSNHYKEKLRQIRLEILQKAQKRKQRQLKQSALPPPPITATQTVPAKVDYSIFRSYRSIYPQHDPSLHRLFFELTSAMGNAFRAMGLIILKAPTSSACSMTNQSRALTDAYYKQTLSSSTLGVKSTNQHRWHPPSTTAAAALPRHNELRAITCERCFQIHAVEGGYCAPSSVYFPTDEESFLNSFLKLKQHLEECHHISPTRRRYISGVYKDQDYSGTLNEGEFITHFCKVFNLFQGFNEGSRNTAQREVKEAMYDNNMTAIEGALKTTSMTFRAVLLEDTCELVDEDIVLDDPLCLIVLESLEAVHIHKKYSLPEQRQFFNHESVMDSEIELFALQCSCCRGRRKDGSYNEEAVVLLRDGHDCTMNVIDLFFNHIQNCLSGHRLLRLQALKFDRTGERYATFAASVGRHIASLAAWAQETQIAEASAAVSCDHELWRCLSIEEFRELFNSKNIMPVADILGPTSSGGGGPGSAVLDCVAFPRMGILHGRMEFPTQDDLKMTFKKRKFDLFDDSIERPVKTKFEGSKVKDFQALPVLDLSKAQKYTEASKVVILDE